MSPAGEARARFAAAFGGACRGVAVAPGRVNLIGEHTDYNDGFVLPMAIERSAACAFALRDDGVVRAHASSYRETLQFPLEALEPGTASGWLAHVAGVVWAIRSAGLPVRGVDISIASDVPIGAGLSSSAAIEMAVARAMCAATESPWEPARYARIAQQAENDFVGLACGIMDPFASGAAAAGSALLLDCRSLDARAIAASHADALVSHPRVTPVPPYSSFGWITNSSRC